MILSINIFSRTLICSFVCLALFFSAGVHKSEAASGDIVPSFITGPVAVYPVSNHSGTIAPLNELRQFSIERLRELGVDILDDDTLDAFMLKHRVRYVGGIDRAGARALKKETGAAAVLIISLEHYDETEPPKLAMTFRLVSTGNDPGILWMESAGVAGDDSPGILGLGLINDPRDLLKEGVRRIISSLSGFERGMNAARQETMEKFEPKIFHRSSFVIEKEKRYTIAVLPFFNISKRKYAGEIMELHFLREMLKLKKLDLIEPGLVRNALLKSRVIMRDGISLDNAKVISSMLNADFVLTGTVISYHDYTGGHGVPRVDFSVMLIERRSGEAVWTSKSYNEGDDSVFFFDLGKVRTAHEMASGMSAAVTEMMFLQ